MKRTNIITIAMTKSMWMNPPKVYDDTRPNSQRTINIIAIVSSILILPIQRTQCLTVI